jgi:hypothetical protein
VSDLNDAATFHAVGEPVNASRLATLLLLALLGVCARAHCAEHSQGDRAVLPIDMAAGTDIEVKGDRVCLRRKPDKDGRIQLDCAIGLRGDDERFYGLRAADPTRIQPLSALHRIRVTGRLVPSTHSQFEESGVIVYTSIQPIDDPKRVTGTFACRKHDLSTMKHADECKPIVATDRGLHWGLDRQALERMGIRLTDGGRVSVEAELLQSVHESWHPWMCSGANNRIEGVLRVTRLQRLPARSP